MTGVSIFSLALFFGLSVWFVFGLLKDLDNDDDDEGGAV